MKNILLLLFFLAAGAQVFAQEDLLKLLGEEKTTDYITNAFKSPRVINSHSMEMLSEGTLDFRILHRFGNMSLGDDPFYNFLGLDQASMRVSFDYGITPNLMVGLARSTYRKEWDGYVKYRILWQSEGKKNMPVSLVWVSGMTLNGLKNSLVNPTEGEYQFSQRLGYYHQLIVGRKFNQRFTLQLSPTIVHNNLVLNNIVPNTLYALGVGGRYKVSNRIALVWDYTYAFNRFPNNLAYNPLSLGVDIETGGHVFQLHLSNSAGMNERAFISDNGSNFNWLKGDIRLGFNLSRVFQLKESKLD